jgi:hypothetical protein
MNLNELAKELSNLPETQRQRLFTYFNVGRTGSPPTFIVTIHDSEGEDIDRPRVAVTPYEKDDFDYIDILASIENDLLSLGHPAILLSIRRWEQLIRYGKRNPLYKIALRHLESVSKSILKGVRSRKVDPNEIQVAREEFIYSADNQYIFLAWGILGQPEIKTIKNHDLRISEIKKKMAQAPIGGNKQKVDRLCAFIRDRSWHTRRRPTRRAFQNDYLAWCSQVSSVSAGVARSRASGKFIEGDLNPKYLQSNENEDHRYFYTRSNAEFAGGLPNWGDLPVVYLS